MRTMTWDFAAALYNALLPFMGVNKNRWKLRVYRIDGKTKVKTTSSRSFRELQPPIETEDLDACDWGIRILPPHTAHETTDILIDTDNQAVVIVRGRANSFPILLNVNGIDIPLEIDHPDAVALIVSEIQMLMAQASAA